MEKSSDKSWISGRRITVQIIVDVILWLAVGLPVLYVFLRGCLFSLLAVGLPVLYVFLRGTPVERGFFCDDPALSYPYKPDTISTPLLIILGFTTSVLVIIVVEILNSIHSRCTRYCQNTGDLVYCVKGYAVFLLGFVVHELVVETVKNQTGYLRPHFFDLCRPQFNTSLCPGYITNYICTGTDHEKDEFRDMRQSFPSGHSSFSMYIAAYFTLYIQYRLNIRFSRFLKFLLQSGLLFVALLCGISRIQDNKHHPSDVIVGFLVGAGVALAVYKTVGSHLLLGNSDDDKSLYDVTDGPETFCCTCASSSPTLEPQTPAPLLANEYTDSYVRGNNNTRKPRPKIDIPFKVRRHMSTPITPTREPFVDV